jgi:hypothetical protein
MDMMGMVLILKRVYWIHATTKPEFATLARNSSGAQTQRADLYALHDGKNWARQRSARRISCAESFF